MNLRIIPYFLSQYCWLIIFSLPLLALVSFSSKITTKDFFSQNSEPEFDSSINPFWMLHSTDIHLNSVDPTSYNKTLNALSKAIQLLKPKQVIFTGDLVDNKNPGENLFRPYTEQKKADWDLYVKLLDQLGLRYSKTFVQVAGNHDYFDLINFNSSHHYAKGIVYNETTFLFNRHKIDTGIGTASILAVNPYEMPAPTLRLTWFTSPTTKTLEKIKNELKSNTDTIQIIAQHHPVSMIFPSEGTTKDASYAEIIKQMTNVRLILSGHRHPKKPVFRHWGDALEVIGTPLFRYPNHVGLVTIDNRRLAYHDIDLNEEHIAVMTSPSPSYQASGLDVFSQRKSEIRALYFGETPGNLSVTGAVNGQLNCSKEIDDNIWLCNLPFELPNGNYNLHKVGDWSGDVNFIISSTISGFEENKYQTDPTISYTFLYAWVTIICIIITFPIGFSGIGSTFEQWVRGKSDTPNWIFAVFAGFIAVRHRLCRSHIVIRIAAFVASFWPIILPLSLFGIEDKPAMFWAWDWVGDGKARTGYEGTMFGLYYLYLVVLAFILVTSAIEATSVRSLALIFDIAVYIAATCGAGYYTYTFSDWFGIPWAITSPAFSLFPIAFIALTIWNLIRTRKDESHVNKDIFDQALLNE